MATVPVVAIAEPARHLPPIGGAFDYQLGGSYVPDARVTTVVRDSTAQIGRGLYNICYVNGFQTQPAQLDWWLANAPVALLRDGTGGLVADPAWPDEYALDTGSDVARSSIAARIGDDILRCAQAGFDAVELDNLDSWHRFDGLTRDGNLELAGLLIDRAHGLGLAVGQKNAPELAHLGPAAGFDFAISEECAIWAECGAYAAQYGPHHLDVEYADDLSDGRSFRDLCGSDDQPERTVLRDRLLRVPGQDGYAFRLCADRD